MNKIFTFDFGDFNLDSFVGSTKDIDFNEWIYHVRLFNSLDENIISNIFYRNDFKTREEFVENLYNVLNYKVSFIKDFYISDTSFSICITSSPIIKLGDSEHIGL